MRIEGDQSTGFAIADRGNIRIRDAIQLLFQDGKCSITFLPQQLCEFNWQVFVDFKIHEADLCRHCDDTLAS